MILTLYSQDGTEKTKISASDSSTQEREVQSDNVLSLSFSLYEYVSIDVNDYIDFENVRYIAMEGYRPEMKNTQEWAYNVKFYGPESLIKRFLVLNTTDGDAEPVFTLTAPAADHMRLIVKCINAGMGSRDWKVGAVAATDNIVIDYEGKYCDEALKELAEKAGVEYWIEGTTVNLSRCEHGETIVMGYGNGLTGLDQDKADNVKFYTRLFPIGSSRNIDPGKYGHNRLTLPGGKKYVDIEPLVQQYGVIHHYEKDTFSGIYPRRIGTVSDVRHKEAKNEDGTPFTIYYFKDKDLNFNPDEYMLAGQVLRVSFQEGSELSGLGTGDEHYFEVNYNAKDKDFEIITIWPYHDGTQLPGGLLVPKSGDKYILWNLRMPDEYITLAENEFLQAVSDYNAKHAVDIARYKAQTDHVWIEERDAKLTIGQRVRLESKKYFPKTGFRDSRITKITRRVNLPSLMDLEISDALSTGAKEKINDSIKEVRNYTRTLIGSARLPDIVHVGDLTPLTDNNILSALRAAKEFVSRLRPDTVQGLLRLLAGVKVGKGDHGIDQLGNALLNALKTTEIENSGDIITKNLTVTGLMHVFELVIDHMKSAGGAVLLTPADGFKVDKVEAVAGGYKLYWRVTDGSGRARQNMWEVGDQALCQTHNGLAAGTTYNASNKLYWCAVTDRNKGNVPISVDIDGTAHDCNFITISATVKMSGCMVNPAVGDEIVQLGYRGSGNPERQSAIYLSAYSSLDTGLRAPLLAFYRGINDFDLASHRKTYFDARKNKLIGEFEVETGGQSQSLDKYIEEHSAAGQSAALWKIISSAGAISDLGGKLSFKVQKIADGVAQTFSEQYLLNVEKCGLYAYDGTDDYSTPGKSLNVGVEYPIADLYKSAKYLNIVLKSGTDSKVLATLTLNEAGKVSLPDVYSIVTSKRAIDNASDMLTVTVKKNESSLANQAALQAQGLSLLVYDGIDDFTASGHAIECGKAVRIADLYKSAKYLNIVLKKGSKVLDVKTLLPVGASEKVYQYWIDPPALTVRASDTGFVEQKGATTKLYVRNADGTAAQIKAVRFFISNVYDAGGDCSVVYDFTTYAQGECEIRVTSMQTVFDSELGFRYPVPAASVRLEIEMQDGTKMNAMLTVTVDYSKSVASFQIMQDRVRSVVASVDEHTKSISKIEQRSNDIDLRVKSMGLGRNLLRDTEFDELKNVTGGVSLIMDDSKKHGKAGGVYIEQKDKTSFTGTGLRYKAKVEPNTNYIGSVWVMAEDAASIDQGLFIEFMSNRDGKGSFRDHLSTHKITPNGFGVWERFEFVFTTPSDCKQVEMNVYLAQNGVLYLSEPQLERQLKSDDKASPWSPYGGLLEAGLNLNDGTFTATGENFLFKLPDGRMVLAINEHGKLKAELIEAQEITGEMIAQPFRTYNTAQEFVKAKSFSWRVTQPYANFGNIIFSARFDGTTINIYNDTSTEISLSLALQREGLREITIPAKMMLRAAGLLHTDSNSTRWYLLCPYETAGTKLRLVDFKKA